MGKLYRIHPTCPHCREEHLSLVIQLTDEEQTEIDEFNAKHKNSNWWDQIMDGPGLIVQRHVICGCCKQEFMTHAGVWEEDALDFNDPNYIPIGKYPVF